jgi:hypothetical protein
MRGVFQVQSIIAVMTLAAAVDAYPGYAHNEFYSVSAPSHEQEYYVSALPIHVSQNLFDVYESVHSDTTTKITNKMHYVD